MRSVAIVGVGLIGASFGLALRKSGFEGPILGVSSTAAIEAALAAGAISRRAELEEAAGFADLIYLAAPVDRIIETIAVLGEVFAREPRPGALVTDAGSTKTAIVETAARYLKNVQFVGGHPMAGKESRGAQSAEADLFRNRTYVLTTELAGVPEAFLDMLQAMGANLLAMTPEKHDATVALTSHLPQLISTALAGFLAQQNQCDIQNVFGSGLLDMTRLALSPADLWTSILATNKQNVVAALDSYAAEVMTLRNLVEREDLRTSFAEAGHFARQIRKLDY